MIFSNNKKIDVGWFVYDDFAHKSFDQDFIPINNNTFGCPAVGSMNNKLFEVLPLFDLDVIVILVLVQMANLIMNIQ